MLFNRFYPMEKRAVTPHCLHHKSLTLRGAWEIRVLNSRQILESIFEEVYS